MDPDTLVSEGLYLMMLGMGAVFLFLTLLVLVTWCMSALVMRYPGAEAPGGRTVATGADSQDPSGSRQRLAAVTAAVHFHHRFRREREET